MCRGQKLTLMYSSVTILPMYMETVFSKKIEFFIIKLKPPCNSHLWRIFMLSPVRKLFN